MQKERPSLHERLIHPTDFGQVEPHYFYGILIHPLVQTLMLPPAVDFPAAACRCLDVWSSLRLLQLTSLMEVAFLSGDRGGVVRCLSGTALGPHR